MRHRHCMPFGAEAVAGGVRFRLWAPSARRVDLCLEEGAGRLLPMAPLPGGWHEIVTDAAAPGSRYCFRIDGETRVPDPASRCNPEGVHGPSMVWDPLAFDWQDGAWRGRPWEEAVVYELHVGTFTPQGTFAAAADKLGYLADLGVTAVELMPVAEFPGRRNWGYDGVLAFAPHADYGSPDDLKALVQAAHGHGLMVLLDVVYNHFGPEGNYLHIYAEDFFNPRHETPWGAAINFDGPGCETVRAFVVHNALYWLEEFRLDGLRLDAVHAIMDDSRPHILAELADAVHARFADERPVHLVLENDHNHAGYLTRDPLPRYRAQWNDDFHHAVHVLVTGERDGYYTDYGAKPVYYLGRCLAEGFAYQGETSAYRGGRPRGQPSRHLPPAAFVNFLQNHDQVGNRALGERLSMLAPAQALEAAEAITLLAPQPPLLFMGQEFAAATPFLFFCDFSGELAEAVREGRRQEFARFAAFDDAEKRRRIPDPNDEATFLRSRLDWDSAGRAPHARWLTRYKELLRLRHREIVPRLAGMQGGAAEFRLQGTELAVDWLLGDGSRLTLLANMGANPVAAPVRPPGRLLYATHGELEGRLASGILPPWTVAWFLKT